MANSSYPDDDGSRSVSGRHDTGRQRNSIVDVRANTTANTVGEQLKAGGNMNTDAPTDAAGNAVLNPVRYPVPGGARGSSADYPASAGTNGTG